VQAEPPAPTWIVRNGEGGTSNLTRALARLLVALALRDLARDRERDAGRQPNGGN
jgi:hypothetical protein